MRRHDGDPGALAWLLALIGMALPWLGFGLGIIGGWKVSRADPQGWWLVGAGAACLLADVAIDYVWAHPPSPRATSPT